MEAGGARRSPRGGGGGGSRTAPKKATTGMNTPMTPSSTRPFAKQMSASARITVTAAAVPQIEPGSSSPNGRVPRTTSTANANVQTTASNDIRPASLQ